MKKLGRPTSPKNKRRSVRVTFRLAPAEAKTLARTCRQLKLTPSELLRLLLSKLPA